ncbi:MAG: tetratricopeptide repeat protein [Bryobacteraceae bacterium]
MLATILILLAGAAAATDPAVLWQQAKAYLEHQQYQDARRVLSEAVQAAPKDAALWYYLGVSCAELKDVDASVKAFEKARVLAPKRAEIYFALGLEYWHNGDLAKAKETYRTGLAIDPHESRALQNYALLLMKTGEYQDAIQPLGVLKTAPELSLAARVSLIECYLKSQNRDAARREVAELLSAGIAGPEEETKLGAILVEEGDPDTAEQVLRASLERNPRQAKAQAALGLILLNEKRFPESAQSLQQAVLMAPDSEEYAMAFAESLLLWKRNRELLMFMKEMEPKFGTSPEFQYKKALAYYGATRLSDSVATLEKLLGMNPRRKDHIYYLLGNSYQRMGKLPEAEKAYRGAIEINPKDASYYQELATVLRSEGPDRLDEAITQIQRGRRIAPADPSLALQLALCYESKADLKQAAALAGEAVRARPEMLPGHIALARIYFRLGNRTEGQREKKIVAELEEKQRQARGAPDVGGRQP